MKNKSYIILFHIGFWVINYFYGLLYWDTISTNGRLCFIIPFYVNYFILVPYFFRKATFVSIALWFVLIWGSISGAHALYYYVYCSLNNCLVGMTNSRVVWVGGYVGFYFIAISTGSRLVVDWAENKRIAHALLIKKNDTQIQAMRTNINLPFVHEALDGMMEKAVHSPAAVQDSIIALSNVLRHSLYDAQSFTNSIQKEIDVTRDFLFLSNQNQKSYILLLEVKEEIENILVPPTILVKFIALWKVFYKDTFLGNVALQLESKNNNLTISVPYKGDSFAFVNAVHEKLEPSCMGNFAMHCETFPEYIQLSIKSISYEN